MSLIIMGCLFADSQKLNEIAMEARMVDGFGVTESCPDYVSAGKMIICTSGLCLRRPIRIDIERPLVRE